MEQEGLLPQACDWCPRMCGANRAAGQRGACGAANALLVARAALHFWEEPPLSGEGGSGAVFFSHCPLRCAYCQNAVIAQGQVGKPLTAEQLAQAMLGLQGQGALNINAVTPTHYAAPIRRAVALARQQGLRLPIVWNTSGYETVAAIRQNVGTVDIYLDDFKYADAGLAADYSHAPEYPQIAVAALDAMVEACGQPVYDDFQGQRRLTKGVVVRHLMLPGSFENSHRVVDLLHQRYEGAVLVSLMNQYTPVLAHAAQKGDAAAAATLRRHPELAEMVPDQEYERLLDYADSLGLEYFWQEGGAAEESFIPAFDLTGL